MIAACNIHPESRRLHATLCIFDQLIEVIDERAIIRSTWGMGDAVEALTPCDAMEGSHRRRGGESVAPPHLAGDSRVHDR